MTDLCQFGISAKPCPTQACRAQLETRAPKKKAANLRAIERRMDNAGETQVSLSDPNARAMATTGKPRRVVG